MSQLKIKDGNDWVSIPAGGVGVSAGGSVGDVLVKSSGTDYATEWGTKLPLKLKTTVKQVTYPINTSSLEITADVVSGYEFICWLYGYARYENTDYPITFSETSTVTTIISLGSWSGATRELYLIALYQKI